ncbi:histone-lysine N-methyltransferase ash1 [Cladorrhinum sp. PSN259]|nr:histone-lysine N-methyltransferase ash1 [Cladorrhinum sp. PSN259]
MSGPLTPTWVQPSHPEIQEVIISPTADPESFSTKSISRVNLPPFGLFAKLDFPPCTPASEPTYATVQMGRDEHLNLNSDLLYINHSCDPSLIFDMAAREVIAGPKGLKEGDELTFFYPSTEWHMAQPFTCLCGTPQCRGLISGAQDMAPSQLEGLWLNGHIRELLREKQQQQQQQQKHSNNNASKKLNGHATNGWQTNGYTNGKKAAEDNNDPTAIALRNALTQAEKMVEAARIALITYVDSLESSHEGLQRRGPTSRELSGEMGGDTIVA